MVEVLSSYDLQRITLDAHFDLPSPAEDVRLLLAELEAAHEELDRRDTLAWMDDEVTPQLEAAIAAAEASSAAPQTPKAAKRRPKAS